MPAQPHAFFEPFGALGVGVLVVGLAFLLVHWPQNTSKTFSQHAAAHKASIVYYSLLFAIALPLLTLFFITWFVPARHVSLWFDDLIITSAILQFTVTLIPEVGGWKSRWHRALTFCSAMLMLPCMVLVIATSHGVAAIVTTICFAIMLVGLALAAKYQDKHKRTLWLQSSYYAAFFLATLWVAYA